MITPDTTFNKSSICLLEDLVLVRFLISKVQSLLSNALLLLISSFCFQNISHAQHDEVNSASSFVDKAGIVIQYHKQIYRELGDPVILELLGNLGIKHVSTESGTWSQALEDYSKFLKEATERHGITFAITADPDFESIDPHNDSDTDFFASKVGALITGGKPWPSWHPSRADLVGGAAVDYLIGNKEPDHTPSFDTECPREVGENGLTQTIRCNPEQLRSAPGYQIDLTASSKAVQALSSIPMISSPLVNISHYQSTMFDGQTVWNFMQPLKNAGDFGSINLYCWTGSIGACRSTYSNTWGSFYTPQSIIITETGYYTSANPGGDTTVATLNEQAEYLIASMFDMYSMGVPRFYLYSAIDNPYASTNKERSFGVYNADGSPKLAANAISMLMTIFNDSTAPEKNSTPLSYSVSGGGSKLKHLKFERRDGKHIIVVWNELPSLSASHIATSNITVTLPRQMSFEKYVPSELTYSSSSMSSIINFDLSQDPVVLVLDEILPTPTPTPVPTLTATPLPTVTSSPTVTPETCTLLSDITQNRSPRLKVSPSIESVGKIKIKIHKVNVASKSLTLLAKKKGSSSKPAKFSLSNWKGLLLRVSGKGCGKKFKIKISD